MKVFVEAYGCTLNRGEAEEFIEAIQDRGHEIVVEERLADAIAIFTCCVIETTEKHMLRRIGELAGDSSKQLVVCGCLGNTNPAAIGSIAPHAKVFGPAQQLMASASFDELDGTGRRSHDSQPKVGILPIASGCVGNCSYCITKEARGPLKSRPVQEIRRRLEMLVAQGRVEIQICAQDTAAYGKDIGSSLPELMRELDKVKGDFMMRIGMMNPNNLEPILNEMLDVYDNKKVFKFLHLPVQSGSERMLDAMNRGHGPQVFNNIVSTFRARFPHMVISTDIIVGFPGEVEQDFQQSRDLLLSTRPDIVNITRFSPRPGTEAHGMGGKVHGRVAKNRSKELTDLRFDIVSQNYRTLETQRIMALATEYRIEGTTFLRTINYRPVVVPEVLELGKWYEVKITGAEKTHLTGEVLGPGHLAE